MNTTFEKTAAAQQIFTEATSLGDFIERIDQYHLALMESRPINERYIFKCAPTRFVPEKGKGEYQMTLVFEMSRRRHPEPFVAVKHDFWFLPIFDSSSTTDGDTSTESHEVVISLDTLPKLHADRYVPMFATATSIEDFVSMLRKYHEALMMSRPAAQRYALEECETTFHTYVSSKSNKAWGRYRLRMQLSGPASQEDPMGLLKQDFHFLPRAAAGGAYDSARWRMGYTGSVDLDTLPKLQAQFDVLQELNAKHEQHLQEIARRAEAACVLNAEMQKLEQDLLKHRAAIYRLEAAKQALAEQIALETATNTVEPCLPGRAALQQKFPDK